jgi:hypothetical protein
LARIGGRLRAVYAAGNEVPRVYRVAGAGVEIIAHTVDLTAGTASLLASADRLADAIAAAPEAGL